MTKKKKGTIIIIAAAIIAAVIGIIFYLNPIITPDVPSSIEGAVAEVRANDQIIVVVDCLNNNLNLKGISTNDKVIIKYNSVSCDGENYSNPLEVGDTVSFSFWEADESTKDSQGYVTINVDDLNKLNRVKDSRFA